MRETWQQYFNKERQLRTLAVRAGIAGAAAARLNERLVHRLPPALAARVLLIAARTNHPNKENKP